MQEKLASSCATNEADNDERSFKNLEELAAGKLDFLDTSFWTVVNRNSSLAICRIMSVVLKSDCSIQ